MADEKKNSSSTLDQFQLNQLGAGISGLESQIDVAQQKMKEIPTDEYRVQSAIRLLERLSRADLFRVSSKMGLVLNPTLGDTVSALVHVVTGNEIVMVERNDGQELWALDPKTAKPFLPPHKETSVAIVGEIISKGYGYIDRVQVCIEQGIYKGWNACIPAADINSIVVPGDGRNKIKTA